MLPLGLLCDGEVGKIVGVTGADEGTCASRAEDMGFSVGNRVRMLSTGPARCS